MMGMYEAAMLGVFIAAVAAVCVAFTRSSAGRRLAELLGFGDEPEWMKH